MPACPQCGAEASESANFCLACGLRLSASAQAEGDALAAPRRRWGGRKVVLGFLVAVAVLALAFLAAMIYFIRNTTIVTSSKGNSRVESPIGVLATSNDPNKIAKSLGLDVYPGAVGKNSAQADLNANSIASLLFHANATPRQVIEFYHVRYPDATVKPEGKAFVLVQMNGRDTLTVKATPEKSGTEIEINDIRR